LGVDANSWKHPATHGVSTVMPWRGFSGIRLQWTQRGRRFLRAQGNNTLIDPRQESRFRRLEPNQEQERAKENLRWNLRKVIPNEPEDLGPPFKAWSLKGWWTRFWIWAKTPTVWRRKEQVLNRFGLRTFSIYGQFWNKIILYPVIEGAYVNTKNWYKGILTCGPNLAGEYHSAGDFLQRIR
jgi:hypothetical protein